MTLYQIADSNVFTFDKSSSTLGNGVVETRGYNSDNTLSTISFGGSGTAIGNLAYTWDSNKNKTSETIGGVMSPYSFTQAGTTYDAEDRLTGFTRAATSGTPQLSQSWNLSAVGDWNSVTTNGTAQSRTHGPTHELVTAGGQSVTHDTKGNMLFIPASVRANSSPLVLTWDFDNRMVSADVGADSVIDVTHQYDALGRRVARTASGSTTVFVQVDQQTISDYVSGAAPASSTYRYLYGSYIDEPIVRIATSNSEMTWYHRNQQYSIVACTNSSGAATERYAYTAYGLPTITDGSGTVRTSSAIGNRYTYTGREWDGVLGLYHYRARMYEATVGRFCSRDPIGYVDGPSFYEFVGTKPTIRTDPSGFWSVFGDGWDLPGFAWHYWFGGGDIYYVDPEDMENFIQGSTISFNLAKTIVRASVVREALTARCGRSITINGSERIEFGLDHPRRIIDAVVDDRAILNSGYMLIAWNCEAATECCSGSQSPSSLSYACHVEMMYTDRFANPFDVNGPYYETPRHLFKRCVQACIDKHGIPRGRNRAYEDCFSKCRQLYPESDHLGTPFGIRGFYSLELSQTLEFRCCDE
jgi:RHS repeat-associated protein